MPPKEADHSKGKHFVHQKGHEANAWAKDKGNEDLTWSNAIPKVGAAVVRGTSTAYDKARGPQHPGGANAWDAQTDRRRARFHELCRQGKSEADAKKQAAQEFP